MGLKILSLRVPRESENTPEQTAQLLASLARSTRSAGLLDRLAGTGTLALSLEVTLVGGQITFAIACPDHLESFVRSQVLATYPDCVIKATPDYLEKWDLSSGSLASVLQRYAAYFPLRDYADYKDVDPMLPMLGVLSHAKDTDKVLIQFILTPAPPSVQSAAYVYTHPQSETGKTPSADGKKLVDDKLSQPLVRVSIHFAASNPDHIHDLSGAISVLNRPDGNSLVTRSANIWNKSKLGRAILGRMPFKFFLHGAPVLNVMELSSLWHLPGVYTKLPNVAWSPSRSLVEPPENLPIFTPPQSPPKLGGEGEARGSNGDVNFFAKAVYKNQEAVFGLKLEDRLRHLYILGKSGTGKSTMLENMAVDDFKKGRGVAFIDPHGDSAEALLSYIPKNRVNDTIYFNPADREHPIALNILEVEDPDQAELVASGIVAIFHKLYGHSWGPRLEYILRNTVLTLAFVPGSTLPDVITMLTDAKFRQKIYKNLKNPQLLAFWQKEFDPLDEKIRLEHISSILNKVGQFVSSPLIQNLISRPKSTINLKKVLDSGQILIANLSTGRLGEDNSALLGAMLITQLELAALNRVHKQAEERRPFFLYVDEFQNFATTSFIKILSEARKFKLGLVLANQYIAQIPEDIQKAIFGNAGSVVCFVLGAEDARVMEAEFGGKFTKDSLVALQKYQIGVKMTIDSEVSQPFLATTLPPLKSTNQNRQAVIDQSRMRYSWKPTKS